MSLRPGRPPGALFCTLAAVAVLGIAGCGGSGNKSSSNTSSNAANGTTGRQGDFAARRAQLAACLKKQGITLPAPPNRPPGQGGRGQGGLFGGGGGGGGGGRFRQFFSDPKFRAAAQKCGFRFGQGGRFRNPAFRAQIQRFVDCVRKNGYPQIPNPSPTGPPFRSNQINRNDPKFQAAARKCAGLLPRGPGGGPGGPGGGGGGPGGGGGAGGGGGGPGGPGGGNF